MFCNKAAKILKDEIDKPNKSKSKQIKKVISQLKKMDEDIIKKMKKLCDKFDKNI